MRTLVTDPVYEAMEFEHVMRPKAGDDLSRKVYAIKDRPGVYIRISASVAVKEGKVLPGVFVCKFGADTYYLREWREFRAELTLAGFSIPGQAWDDGEEEAAKE